MLILKTNGQVEDIPLNAMYSDGLFERRIRPSTELRRRFYVTIRKDGSKGVEVTADEAKELTNG